MAEVYKQLFASSTTDLATLSPEVGTNGFTQGGAANLKVYTNNNVYSDAGAGRAYTSEPSLPNNIQVSAQINYLSTGLGGREIRILARHDGASNNGYALEFAANAINLYKVTAGATTLLGTASVTNPTGALYTVKLVCDGDAISAFFDGTEVVGPITDATYASGQVGIQYMGLTGATTRAHLKNYFIAEDVGSLDPPDGDSLLFTVHPTTAIVGDVIVPPIEVSIVDSTKGNAVDTTKTDTITVGNDSSDFSGTLAVAAVAGVATFPNVTGLKIRADLTLNATAPGLTGATSNEVAITAPSGAAPDAYIPPSDPMHSLILKGAVADNLRQMQIDIATPTGVPYTGSLTGVKAHIEGVESADANVYRTDNGACYIQLTVEESNSTKPVIVGRIPAAAGRAEATARGIITPVDWTQPAESAASIAAAVIASAQENGVSLTAAQVVAMTKAGFRAAHYADGYGVSRNGADTQMAVITPGDSPENVTITPATGRPSVVEAGAGVTP